MSPGTIHVRVEKMRQSGLIEGTKAIIDERKLGYDVLLYWHYFEKCKRL